MGQPQYLAQLPPVFPRGPSSDLYPAPVSWTQSQKFNYSPIQKLVLYTDDMLLYKPKNNNQDVPASVVLVN